MLKILIDLKNNEGFIRYFKNTSWLMGEQMLRMIAAFFVGLWVARYLGPEQFGTYSYVLAFASIFSVIAKLGLDSIVVRDLINEPDKRNIYLGTAFWLKLIGAMSTLVIVVMTTIFTNNDHKTNLYIFIIASGLIFQSFEVVDFYFQSQVLARIVSICKLMQLLLSSSIKLYLIYKSADLFWFMLVSLIDQIILAISFFIAYRSQKLGGFYKYFDLNIAKKLMLNSWPQIFSGFVIMIYMRIDQIMIKEMLGETAVGLYSAAVKLSELWYFIPIIISNSILPAIVGAKKRSNELYYFRLQKLYTFMVWAAILLAIPITMLSDWLVTFCYGVEYFGSGHVLAIYTWASIFVFYGCARGQWLVVENMQMYGLFCTSIGAITNILLNCVLIKKLGVEGAAISTFISYGVSSIIAPLMFYKDRISASMFFKAFLFKGIRI